MRTLWGIGSRGPATWSRRHCLSARKAKKGRPWMAGHRATFRCWTVVSLLPGLLLSGCAGAPVRPVPPAETFLFHTAPGPVQVMVIAAPPDAPGEISSAWRKAAMLGAIVVPLGLVAPPMAASGLVVGGGLLLVLSATGQGIEGWGVTTVARALQEADFPGAVADALRKRGTRLAPTGTAPIARATVALEAWGVVSRMRQASGRHCFVAGVTLSVEGEGRSADLTRVDFAAEPRLDGMPLAQCASLEKFAAEGGRLVREAARDYAELLAVVIGERLEGLRCDSE